METPGLKLEILSLVSAAATCLALASTRKVPEMGRLLVCFWTVPAKFPEFGAFWQPRPPKSENHFGYLCPWIATSMLWGRCFILGFLKRETRNWIFPFRCTLGIQMNTRCMNCLGLLQQGGRKWIWEFACLTLGRERLAKTWGEEPFGSCWAWWLKGGWIEKSTPTGNKIKFWFEVWFVLPPLVCSLNPGHQLKNKSHWLHRHLGLPGHGAPVYLSWNQNKYLFLLEVMLVFYCKKLLGAMACHVLGSPKVSYNKI